MAVNVIKFPLVQAVQMQVLAVEPSARVNQISVKSEELYLKDTAVTFYVIYTAKPCPFQEPYICTMSVPPQQSEE